MTESTDFTKIIQRLLDQGATTAEIAATLGMTQTEVMRWRAKILAAKKPTEPKPPPPPPKPEAPKEEPKKPGSGKRQQKKNPNFTWTADKVDLLKRMWVDGERPGLIAERLGTTEDSVHSKIRRLVQGGWDGRGPGQKSGQQQGPKNQRQSSPKGQQNAQQNNTNSSLSGQVRNIVMGGDESKGKAKSFFQFTKKYMQNYGRRTLEENFGLLGAWAAIKFIGNDTKEKGEAHQSAGSNANISAVIDKQAKVVDASLNKIGATLARSTSALARSLAASGEKHSILLNEIRDGLRKMQGPAQMVGKGSSGLGGGATRGDGPGLLETLLGVGAGAAGIAALSNMGGDKNQATPPPGKEQQELEQKGQQQNQPTQQEIPKLDVYSKKLDFKVDRDITFKAPIIEFQGAIRGLSGYGGGGGGGTPGGPGGPGGTGGEQPDQIGGPNQTGGTPTPGASPKGTPFGRHQEAPSTPTQAPTGPAYDQPPAPPIQGTTGQASVSTPTVTTGSANQDTRDQPPPPPTLKSPTAAPSRKNTGAAGKPQHIQGGGPQPGASLSGKAITSEPNVTTGTSLNDPRDKAKSPPNAYKTPSPAAPTKNIQGGIDRSRFNAELQAHPELISKMASMVKGEVGETAPLNTKITQLETAFNRAQSRNIPLSQALLSVGEDPRRGYYARDTYSRPADAKEIEDFRSKVLGPVMSGSDISSEGGFGPMTGNASGSVAAHQFARGTPGYTRQTAGGLHEGYFNEEKGSNLYRLQHLPRLGGQQLNQLSTQPPPTAPSKDDSGGRSFHEPRHPFHRDQSVNDPPPTSKRDHAFQDDVPGLNDQVQSWWSGMGA